MNIILLEPIANLGGLGDEISVKAGYARNYLLPQGKAVSATAENRKVFEARRAELEAAANEKLAAARARAEKVHETTVTVLARVGDEGRLYGSVGTQEIATALGNTGSDVAKSEVRMPEGVIRTVGEYDIDIQFHNEVTATVRVIVAAE